MIMNLLWTIGKIWFIIHRIYQNLIIIKLIALIKRKLTTYVDL